MDANGASQVHPPVNGERWIVQCAWCRRYRFAGDWVVEEDMCLAQGTHVTHGICLDCAAKLEARIPEKIKG